MLQTSSGQGDQETSALAFAAEAVSRNRDILDEREQAVLRAATVLVAGCGSVGGAVVEPLVRLGVIRLRLADPDRYDVTNLNRQAGVLADVGHSKPEVLAARVLSINPHAQVSVYPEGLTLDNLDAALVGAQVVFDGIDPSMSGWVKYQLHERAARQGIPVLAGADFGGKPVVYVFDYRRDATPFHGRATADAHRNGDVWESLRWFGRSHFPSDFLPVMADRWRNGGDWPQISYCVLGMGALGSRAIVDLLMGRRLRRVITVDFHAATKPRLSAMAHRAAMPWRLVRTLSAIRQRRRQGTLPQKPQEAATDQLPPLLATVLEGARLAPSAYNSQPWRFQVQDATAIQLVADLQRWPDADARDGEWAASLGCALGVMSYLAKGVWIPSATAVTGDGWCAGTFVVESLHPDAIVRQGVVGSRATARTGLLGTPIDAETIRQIVRIAAEHEVVADVVTEPHLVEQIAHRAGDLGARSDAASLPALWSGLLTRSRSTAQRDQFGSARELLGLSPLRAGIADVMLRLNSTAPLAQQLLARDRVKRLRECGALVVLRGRDDGAARRISAGAALAQVWLQVVESGYAAQPLYGEFAKPETFGAAGIGSGPADSDGRILALLRVGRATTPAPAAARRPLTDMVRWP